MIEPKAADNKLNVADDSRVPTEINYLRPGSYGRRSWGFRVNYASRKIEDDQTYPSAQEITQQLGGTWRALKGEGEARCPAHPDKRPSLGLANGNNGRPLVHCRAGCSQEQVISALRARGLWPDKPIEAAPRKVSEATPRPAPAPPPTPLVKEPDFMKVLKKQPSQVWTYYSPDGAPIFYVARINNADGSKAAVLPVSFDGHQWVGAAHPEPRPLYNLPELAAHPDKPVLLVEGEKTADAAKHLVSDFVVTTWSGGSGATAKTDFTPLVGRDVVLWPDNDDAGLKAMRAVADILTGARTLRGVKVPQGLEKGWDLADALPVDLDPVALIGRAIDLRKAKLASLKIISAAALQAKVFRPPRWAVPDYLPEGLAIGAGKPKTGKSWLFLGTAIGVAAGTAVFGNVKVEQGDVLAILLEDPERRVQTRMKALLQGERFPERLQIATEWRKADQGGLDDIRLWLQAHPEARLVIIDTLAKIRGKADRDKGVYADDYDVISAFKKLADEFRVAILLVHHLKKEGATDPLDAISGTAGLTGAADTLMVLKREPNDKNALLYVRGRDVNEAEVALEFDDDTGRWTRLGAGEDFRKSEERRAVLAVLREVGGLSPREIAEATNMKPGNVRVLLHKMRRNGEVNQLNGGKYEIGC